MSARCPITGSCPFFVVRQREVKRKLQDEALFQVFSSRDALKSDCLSTHACQPAIFNALPRPRRCLPLGIYWPTVPKSEEQQRANSEQQAIKRLASPDATGAGLLRMSQAHFCS